jgi:hypothetical protein
MKNYYFIASRSETQLKEVTTEQNYYFYLNRKLVFASAPISKSCIGKTNGT